MLEILKIKNIAIIDTAEIRFREGLNIISGETGAGKSIIIEAISLLLGSRASIELIRSGCDEAVVEGLFHVSEIPWMGPRLQQLGFAKEDGSEINELLIKRTVHRAGRHRISVNGELATLSILQNLCEGLIDLCGQHEHQSLLKSNRQIELLDRYGGLSEQAKVAGDLLKQLHTHLEEQERLQTAHQERETKSGFLKFQIEEIRAAHLEPEEDQALQREKQLLQSVEYRVQAAETTHQMLESDEPDEQGCLNSLRTALQKLRSLNSLDQTVQHLTEGLERALVETEEVALGLNRYLSSTEASPQRLQVVQERLSLVADLRRKYGQDVYEILNTLGRLENEFMTLGATSEKLEQLTSIILEIRNQLLKQGKALSIARQKVSKTLADSVTHELKDLKMGDARFLIEVTPKDDSKEDLSDWNSYGADYVQFLVQTNRGEPSRPLGKIASGGELSRLLLAIRRVISDRGGIGVYLFDEIDAGIGGQTAFQVGKKLKSVASYNQVICITHLPQVASFANHHLIVRKVTVGQRTMTEIAELSPNDRTEELARMLGGPELTQKSLENASELLELAGK